MDAHPPDANRLFKNQDYKQFPVCTQVTLNHGICDSKCRSCPVGRVNFGDASEAVKQEFHYSRRVSLPFAVFKQVADEVAQHPHAWLRMHSRGEPLLHPRFVDMVAYAKQAGVRLVQAFTDAITLDEKTAVSLLNAGLDVLECSVHGHTTTYEQLMRNGKFEQVQANIVRFRRLRDNLHGPTRLVVSAVDQPLFQPEKEAHHTFWSQYADEVIYRPYHSWGNRIDKGCAAVPEQRPPCSQLWKRCTISPAGKILACFNSWSEREEEVLGDLTRPGTTIAGVWQSAHYQQIRQGHVDGAYTLPCCQDCQDWAGSAWDKNSYEHLLDVKLSPEKAHA